jgi:hypothetical protein
MLGSKKSTTDTGRWHLRHFYQRDKQEDLVSKSKCFEHGNWEEWQGGISSKGALPTGTWQEVMWKASY